MYNHPRRLVSFEPTAAVHFPSPSAEVPRKPAVIRHLTSLVALAALTAGAHAQSDPIRIALVYEKTGGWESYAVQLLRGATLGLEYATGGTMELLGRKVELIEKDNQLKPDLSRALLEEAYADDGAIAAIGPISSGNALAMLPVAEEYGRLLFPVATAHSITGEKWVPTVFRTISNTDHMAIAGARVLEGDGTHVAILTQDYAFGRDGAEAFKSALEGTTTEVVAEEYAPTDTKDFTPFIQRMFDALKGRDGRKVIWVFWGGGKSPIPAIKDADPERHGIEISTRGNSLAVLKGYKKFPGMEGAIYYYYDIPDNPVNDWLVERHNERHGSPPDLFTAAGMDAAITIVEGIKRAGTTDVDSIVEQLRGMEVSGSKGTLRIRPEDHQALQPMYHYRVVDDPGLEWAVPAFVREIAIEEIDLPIRNGR